LPYHLSVQQRLPSKFEQPILFAHRGAKAHSAENTLESFELAVRLGATGLETDVWLSKDGLIVCDHDGVVNKRLRRIPIKNFNRDDLASSIPSLEELFERCGTGVNYSIDVCDESSIDQIHELVSRGGSDFFKKVWLCSPNFLSLCQWHDKYPNLQLVNSIRLSKIAEGPERRCANLAKNGITALNMHHTDWNGGLVALAHRFGLAAFSWDIQHIELICNAFRMGVDAVFSDWTDRMVDAYRTEFSD
jgi:glycerophosphoryl diester phosphodiesterase